MNYNKKFYNRINQNTADVIIDIFKEVSALTRIENIIDIGCGNGFWLNTIKTHFKYVNILGVDGKWAEKSLIIDNENFIATDLNKGFEYNGKFDLAITIETAEHLKKENSQDFIDNLCKLSNFVLFSAAIPEQGGVDHINEQWQSYWSEKFKKNKFVGIDFIRPKIWKLEKVPFYLCQNIILYIHEDELQKNIDLNNKTKDYKNFIYDIIHPTFFLNYKDPKQISAKFYIKNFFTILKHSIKRFINEKK